MSKGRNSGNGKNRFLDRFRNVSNSDVSSQSEDASESGFGSSFTSPDIRLMNKDGSLNVAIKGLDQKAKFNLYKNLIRLKGYQFYSVIFILYLILNGVFACLYMIIGLEGLSSTKANLSFWDAFFFSTQSFTTVGYGHISPNSYVANVVASSEAFIGLLFFAIATGLVYGRFSTSKSDLRFSDNILINRREDDRFLMIRVANVSNTELTDLDAQIIMSYIEPDHEGRNIRQYKKLPLELPRINLLTTSWTIVHKITDQSPCKLLEEDYTILGLEFMIFLNAFDDVFDQQIKVRTSYTAKDIIQNAKFDPITSYGENSTVVDLELLSSYHLQE